MFIDDVTLINIMNYVHQFYVTDKYIGARSRGHVTSYIHRLGLTVTMWPIYASAN
jgi:hypothetical protein